MKHKEKPDLVKMFLRGKDIADVSVFFGVSRGTVQRILREAITQLAALNVELAKKTMAVEAVPTGIEAQLETVIAEVKVI